MSRTTPGPPPRWRLIDRLQSLAAQTLIAAHGPLDHLCDSMSSQSPKSSPRIPRDHTDCHSIPSRPCHPRLKISTDWPMQRHATFCKHFFGSPCCIFLIGARVAARGFHVALEQRITAHHSRSFFGAHHPRFIQHSLFTISSVPPSSAQHARNLSSTLKQRTTNNDTKHIPNNAAGQALFPTINKSSSTNATASPTPACLTWRLSPVCAAWNSAVTLAGTRVFKLGVRVKYWT